MYLKDKSKTIKSLGCKTFSEDENPFFDGLATDWTLDHPISAHLTSSVATQKYHVLQAIQTNRAHCLKNNRGHYIFFLYPRISPFGGT